MKKLINVLSILLCVVFLASCAGKPVVEEPVEEGGLIGVIPKSTLYDYWKYVNMGAVAAAEKYGYEVSFQGTALDTDVEGQVKIIEDFVTRGAKAIVISPVDPDAMVPSLKAAHDAGVVIIVINSKLNADFPYSFIATNDYAAGEKAADAMAKIIGDQSGKVAVVAEVAGSVEGGERSQGFIDKISANGKLEVLDTFYSEGDRNKAFNITQDILTSNPDIKGIFSTNEGSSVGVLLAIQSEGVKNVAVIGFDTSVEQIDGIREGVINGTIAQNPFKIGYLGVENAIKVLMGQTVEKNVNAETIYISLENIDSEEVKILLAPPKE